MTKENLIVFIDSMIESSRKIVITSLFLLGIFFAASLSYQSKSIIDEIITEPTSLSSQDVLALRQLLLDGFLIISITIVGVALITKNSNENFKRFFSDVRREGMKPLGFITASVLLFLLPYNIITMAAVLLVKIIWSTIAETYEHMSHFLVKNASVPSFMMTAT